MPITLSKMESDTFKILQKHQIINDKKINELLDESDDDFDEHSCEEDIDQANYVEAIPNSDAIFLKNGLEC